MMPVFTPQLRLKTLLYFSTGLMLTLSPMGAQAQSIDPVPPSPSIVYTISGDGTVVGGTDQSGGGTPFLYYRDGTLEDLSPLLPAGFSNGDVVRLSYDGSVAVGNYTDTGGLTRSYIVSGGVYTDLGYLAPGVPSSFVRALSSNGQVAVGSSSTAAGGLRAFRWDATNTMQALAHLGAATDADTSQAFGVNTDGSIVVGAADDGTGALHAVYWQGMNAPQDMGISALYTTTYGGTAQTGALDISADNNVIIGTATEGGTTRTFRWVSGTTTFLPDAAGFTSFHPSDLSANGNSVVGTAVSATAFEAARWDAATNQTVLLSDILTDAGVNMANWQLAQASGISDDGNTIVGIGMLNGDMRGFIMNATAITTPDELVESLMPIGVTSQQAMGAATFGIEQSMLTARNALPVYFPEATLRGSRPDYSSAAATPETLDRITPAAGGYDTVRKAVYVTGGLGAGQGGESSAYAANGTAGVILRLSDSVAVGGGAVVSHSDTDTRLGGDSRFNALGGSVFASYEEAPTQGVHLYGSAVAAHVSADMKRNYINGGSIDTSKGDTNGWASGASAQAGYMFEVTPQVTVMPYAGLEWSHVSLDGYTENGGGAPATVASQSSDRVVSRLGGELVQHVSSSAALRMRAAWGHEWTDGNGGVSATSMGITQSVDGEVDRDWAEAGIGLTHRLTPQTVLAADINGRTGETSEPQVSGTLSLVVNW